MIAVAAGVWALLLFAEGITVRYSFLRPYELVAGAVVLAVNLYDFWLWRIWPFVHVAPVPLLRGTWRGFLRSNWVDPRTQQPVEPTQIYLVVRQSVGVISAKVFTDNSSSSSTSAVIATEGDGRTFISTYRNVPKMLQRLNSPIHHGTMILDIGERQPSRLRGQYWTDRGTQGEIELDGHTAKVAGELSKAKRLKYNRDGGPNPLRRSRRDAETHSTPAG